MLSQIMLLHWMTAGRLKEHSEAANAVGSDQNSHFLMVYALNAKKVPTFHSFCSRLKTRMQSTTAKEAAFDSK